MANEIGQLGQKLDQILELLGGQWGVPLTPRDAEVPHRQRGAAEAWLIRAFQPFYRQGRPGHTWAEIEDRFERLGDAPECSSRTLRRARDRVMDNVRIEGVSYWRLRQEYEFPED